MRLRFCLVTMFLLSTVAGAPGVRAQAPAATPSTGASSVDEAMRARARELFMEGVQEWNAGHAEAARQKFQSAYDMVHEPSILYNLGNAQVETGHLLDGRASYQRFLAEVTSGPAARHRRDAQRALTQLDARLPQVRARIPELAQGDQVVLDGRAVPSSTVTNGTPIEPGAHELVVRRDGREWAHESFTVAERERKSLAVDLVAPVTAPTPAETARAAQLDEQPARAPNPARRRRIIIGTSVGAGLAVIATVLAIVYAR